eukprot:SAG31_NODE_11043_length_1072_cov_0.786228_1_plen_321_part_10
MTIRCIESAEGGRDSDSDSAPSPAEREADRLLALRGTERFLKRDRQLIDDHPEASSPTGACSPSAARTRVKPARRIWSSDSSDNESTAREFRRSPRGSTDRGGTKDYTVHPSLPLLSRRLAASGDQASALCIAAEQSLLPEERGNENSRVVSGSLTRHVLSAAARDDSGLSSSELAADRLLLKRAASWTEHSAGPVPSRESANQFSSFFWSDDSSSSSSSSVGSDDQNTEVAIEPERRHVVHQSSISKGSVRSAASQRAELKQQSKRLRNSRLARTQSPAIYGIAIDNAQQRRVTIEQLHLQDVVRQVQQLDKRTRKVDNE